MSRAFDLNAAVIAAYPMYQGLAGLLGMKVLDAPDNLAEELALLGENWNKYDFFFVHLKRMDSAGDDGDFSRKVAPPELMLRTLANAQRLLKCGA